MLVFHSNCQFLTLLFCGLLIFLTCDSANSQPSDDGDKRSRGPGRLLAKYDENEDGQLAESEVPEKLWQRLSLSDKNKDGILDAEELEQHMQSFQQRRGRHASSDRRRRHDSPNAAADPTFAAAVKIGDKAPDWSGIVGVDNAEHSLADYTEAKAIVLVFTCNHCPVAKAYEDRLVELQNAYEMKGVQIVAVNVNNMPADRLDKMKERAKEKKFDFPYLYDSTQKIGREYGATKTPEVYLLDQDRRLVYHGAIDDSKDAAKVKVQHLRESIDAVLAGKKPAKAEVQAMGCGIRYE